MVKIKLSLGKDVNSNANFYFEKAKKLKKKLPGIEETIKRTQEEILDFISKKENYMASREKKKKIEVHKKKEWYEKFRYTYTTSGVLVVLGKDAGSNEILMKKHATENDLVFHTETAGSPFGILKDAKKNGEIKVSKKDIEEAMQYVCSFSKQWKKGYGNADGFYVDSQQVSKKANTGEYISRGSFMINGKKNIMKNVVLQVCLGVRVREVEIEDGDGSDEVIKIEELFSGSESACKKYCGKRFIKIEPGIAKTKSLVKEIKKRLKIQYLEELPKYIPNECKIMKR